MVTTNAYYKNELYLPLAKPSITDNTTSVSTQLDAFIWKYEREILVKALGLPLAKLFMAELDKTKPNGLSDSADNKWDWLLNGHEYTNPQGEDVEWLGIRRKAIPTDSEPSISFLANYVYYMVEQNNNEFNTSVSTGQGKAKNFIEVSKAPKVTRAYREMLDIIVGRKNERKEFYNIFGYGVDYFQNNQEVTLYQFIDDMNTLVEDTYPNFKKADWVTTVNRFGL